MGEDEKPLVWLEGEVIEICKRRIRKYDSVVKQEKHEKAEP